ncbi:MAG TPA: acyl-CoA dehydrogenase family protein [Acidimicrobiales bacterium]
MDFKDGPDEARFRGELREWLLHNSPSHDAEGDHGEKGNLANLEWHRRLYAGGWLGLSWPKAYGGQGLTPIYDAIVNEEVGASGASAPSVGYLGRAILHFGSDEQKSEYLPSMLRGDVQWCQGFSEPGAGSDLASLRTRADKRDDVYVVNGQKVWTSRAQWADWCLLLCRTNPELPKHKGISCLVFEMDRPGITVHPLQQTWGTAEFNEVFFDNLEVPVSRRIGEEGDGWPLATTVLAHERGPADIGFISHFQHQLQEFEALLTRLPEDRRAEFAPRVAQAYVSIAACRLHVLKSLSLRAKGVAPGADTSIDKLLMTRVEQELGALSLDVAGSAPLLGNDAETVYRYLRSRAASIYGGTEQIQHSIVAQRILGMQRA